MQTNSWAIKSPAEKESQTSRVGDIPSAENKTLSFIFVEGALERGGLGFEVVFWP